MLFFRQIAKKSPTGPTVSRPRKKPEYVIARLHFIEKGPWKIGPIWFLMENCQRDGLLNMHFGGFFCQFRRVRFHLSLEVKYIGPRSENPPILLCVFVFGLGVIWDMAMAMWWFPYHWCLRYNIYIVHHIIFHLFQRRLTLIYLKWRYSKTFFYTRKLPYYNLFHSFTNLPGKRDVGCSLEGTSPQCTLRWYPRPLSPLDPRKERD